MHPADLATHRSKRARRDRRALAASLRLAYPQATPEDQATLARIVSAVRCDEMTVSDARELVATIRRKPSQRAA